MTATPASTANATGRHGGCQEPAMPVDITRWTSTQTLTDAEAARLEQLRRHLDQLDYEPMPPDAIARQMAADPGALNTQYIEDNPLTLHEALFDRVLVEAGVPDDLAFELLGAEARGTLDLTVPVA